MTADELRKAEAAYQAALARSNAKRDERDALVRAARIAEATGLTRGRVNQIARGRR